MYMRPSAKRTASSARSLSPTSKSCAPPSSGYDHTGSPFAGIRVRKPSFRIWMRSTTLHPAPMSCRKRLRTETGKFAPPGGAGSVSYTRMT